MTQLDDMEAKLDRILLATEVKQATIDDTSATTTIFDTSLTEANDFWDRGTILFTSGNNAGQMRRIEGFKKAHGEITVKTAVHQAPANNDTFIIVAARAFSGADADDIADAVWDEILTGATHNVPASAGRRLRQLASFVIHDGIAQAGSCYSITLAATASVSDHVYNRNLIVIVAGTGTGQTRTIVDYDGTSKIAVVDRDWWITPDATSEYFIFADDTPLVVDQGVARGGENSSITFRSAASAIDDTYTGSVVAIIASIGKGQSRLVTGYNGTTKIATITPAWETNPNSESIYVVMPYGCSCVGNLTDGALEQINVNVADAVLDEQLDQHIASGSFGEKIYGMRARIPLSPWSRKEVDKLFKLIDEIVDRPEDENIKSLLEISKTLKAQLYAFDSELADMKDLIISIRESRLKIEELKKLLPTDTTNEHESLRRSITVSLASISDKLAKLPTLSPETFAQKDDKVYEQFKKLEASRSQELKTLEASLVTSIQSLKSALPSSFQDPEVIAKLNVTADLLVRLEKMVNFSFVKNLSDETLEEYLSEQEVIKSNAVKE